jgi:putative ABC transport system permease protein
MLVRSGLKLAAIGIAIGLGGAVFIGRLLTASLFGVRALDPATFVLVPAVLTEVAAVACYAAARQAQELVPIAAINADV